MENENTVQPAETQKTIEQVKEDMGLGKRESEALIAFFKFCREHSSDEECLREMARLYKMDFVDEEETEKAE